MIDDRRTDRAVSTQLSHLFGIAMTALLITVVLTGATTYVENERTSVVQTQLETIGDRLASEIERADELGRQGGDVSVRTTVQPTVSGKDYEVRLADGSTCDTSNFHTDSCLVLQTIETDVTVKVPLNVSDDMTVESQGGGTYLLGVAGSGNDERTAATVNRPLRIGVGENYEADRFGSVLDASNRPPIARFHFSPGVPRADHPTAFSATRSFDADGEIVAYRWDFEDDGSFDALGENVSRVLDPGPHDVRLQVVDNEGTTSNVTRRLRVSGLAYEGDLTSSEEGAPDFDEGALNFTVTNRYDDRIRVKEVLIDPADDSMTTLDNRCNNDDECPFGDVSNNDEIVIDKGLEGNADSVNEVDEPIPPDGVIVELDQPVRLSQDESAEIWIGAFQGVTDMDDREFELGVRYEAHGEMNSTVFTDVVGSPNVDDYWIETGGGFSDEQVHGVIVADRELDYAEVDLGGDLSGTASSTNMDVHLRSSSPGRYVYELPLGDLDSGVVKANLTVAENDGVSAFETRGTKSLNRTVVILDGDYVWNDAGDWDASNASYSVVHHNVGDRRSNEVRLGYPTADQVESDLEGYWHLDGTAGDASGNGNHGTDNGNPATALGVFGTSSYVFDGSDDYVGIGVLDDIHSDTSSLSMWINTRQSTSGYFYESAGITGVEEYGGTDDVFWGWIDNSGHIGVRAGDDPGARSGTAIDDGAWHHVVLTYDGDDGSVAVYVDGELEDTGTTMSGPIGTPFSSLGRIEDTGGTPEYFEGELDEVRSYDRVLTQDDVDDLYETRGTLVTDWKDGSQPLGPDNATLQYDADVPTNTAINVTVVADTDGDDAGDVWSDRITLQDGQRSVAIEGLGNATATQFKLYVHLESDSVVKTPVLRQIAVRERS